MWELPQELWAGPMHSKRLVLPRAAGQLEHVADRLLQAESVSSSGTPSCCEVHAHVCLCQLPKMRELPLSRHVHRPARNVKPARNLFPASNRFSHLLGGLLCVAYEF